jgi:cytochrome c
MRAARLMLSGSAGVAAAALGAVGGLLAGLLVSADPLSAEGAKKARRERPAPTANAGNLVGHGGPVRTIVAEAGTGRLLTGSFDYTMMLWQLAEDGSARRVRRFDDHDSAVSAVAFHPDGRHALSASDDGVLHLWDLESGGKVTLFRGHTARILGLAIDPGGRWAATASWDRTVRLWDLEGRRASHVLEGHTGPVNSVAFSGDGKRVVSAGYDGTIRLWQRTTGRLERAAYKHGWGINVIRRLEGGEQYLFGALNGTAAIFDLDTGRVVHELAVHEKPVLAVAAVAQPGLVAVGGGDGRISVYRQGDWKELESYQNPFGPVWALAFAERGARLYFGGLDDHATAWQVVPRLGFEPATSRFPRRFQVEGGERSAGEVEFARKCSICHTLTPDDGNRAGPTLFRVFGRRAGTLPGYPYSPALKGIDLVWTPETLGKLFELGPHVYTPGSKMPLQKIADPAKRGALVRYLEAATGPRREVGSGETKARGGAGK